MWSSYMLPNVKVFVLSYLHLEASSSMATIGEIRPGVPQPVCPSGATHAMCSCCMKPMPMLTNLPPLPGGEPYAKSQKCKSCDHPHTRIEIYRKSLKNGHFSLVPLERFTEIEGFLV